MQCGWCGAINETFAWRQKQAELRAQRNRTCWARLMRALTSMQFLVVVIVVLLISSIILLGVAYVLPHTCASSQLLFLFNQDITASFTFLILYNYAACACVPWSSTALQWARSAGPRRTAIAPLPSSGHTLPRSLSRAQACC